MAEMLTYEQHLTSATGGRGAYSDGLLALRRSAVAPAGEDHRQRQGAAAPGTKSRPNRRAAQASDTHRGFGGPPCSAARLAAAGCVVTWLDVGGPVRSGAAGHPANSGRSASDAAESVVRQAGSCGSSSRNGRRRPQRCGPRRGRPDGPRRPSPTRPARFICNTPAAACGCLESTPGSRCGRPTRATRFTMRTVPPLCR